MNDFKLRIINWLITFIIIFSITLAVKIYKLKKKK